MSASTTANNRHETRQTIYFLRHGVAYHNLHIKSRSKDGKSITYEHANLRDPIYTDSKLVLPRAHKQAKAAAKRLKNDLCRDNSKGKTLDCVIVSPLTRCFETAYFVMDELEIEGNSASIPWICKEELREAFGINYSDKRSCRSFLEDTWPFVQFDPQMTEEDKLWKPDKRETYHQLQKRVNDCLLWFSWNELFRNQREPGMQHQQQLFVVSHGVWIECMFHIYKPEILDDGKQRVHNCDLYCVELVGRWSRDDTINSNWVCDAISVENVRFING